MTYDVLKRPSQVNVAGGLELDQLAPHQCDCLFWPDKLEYATREEAISAAVRTWRRLGEKMGPYQCQDTSHWHIGHV